MCCTVNQNQLRVEDWPHKQHFQPNPTLRNGRSVGGAAAAQKPK